MEKNKQRVSHLPRHPSLNTFGGNRMSKDGVSEWDEEANMAGWRLQETAAADRRTKDQGSPFIFTGQ